MATMHTSECNTRKNLSTTCWRRLSVHRTGVSRRVSTGLARRLLAALLAAVGRCVSRGHATAKRQACRRCRRRRRRRRPGYAVVADHHVPCAGLDRACRWARTCWSTTPRIIAQTYGVSDTVIGLTLGGRRHLPAGTGHNGHGGLAPSGGRGLGQCHRVQHVQPSGHYRDRVLVGPIPVDPVSCALICGSCWALAAVDPVCVFGTRHHTRGDCADRAYVGYVLSY